MKNSSLHSRNLSLDSGSAYPAVTAGLFLVLLLVGASDGLAVFGDEENSGNNSVLTEILVEGNTRTDTNVILRVLDLQVGDPFTSEKMDLAWDTLEDVGYFAFVDMEYEEDADGQVSLRIMVEEDITTALGPLVRYSPRFKYMLGGWFEENNFRGKGEILEFSMTFLYPQRAQIAWKRPWLFGVEGLDLEAGLRWHHADFVYRPTSYRQRQAEINLGWKFYRSLFVKGGVNYGRDTYRDSYSWELPYRGEGSPTGTEFYPSGKQTRTAFSASLGLDTRSNPWYPSQGVFLEAQVRHWASEDFPSYTQGSVDARFFVPVPIGLHVLALRAYGRLTDDPAHLDNLLYYGGAENIRGYRLDSREGDEGYLLTAEYRIPLFMLPISPQGEMVGFGLHFFGDFGDAWYKGAHSQESLQSFGGGAHLNIDRLQLRFEAACTKEGDWSFEFMDTFNF